jgi:hypothetical protein
MPGDGRIFYLSSGIHAQVEQRILATAIDPAALQRAPLIIHFAMTLDAETIL